MSVVRCDRFWIANVSLESAGHASGAAGMRYLAVAEEGVPSKEVANVVGRRLNLPVVAKSPDEAADGRKNVKRGANLSGSRGGRVGKICEVFLCSTILDSRVAVRSDVLSEKVKKPFHFWRETR